MSGRDRLREPVPGHNGKRFRDLSLVEQHEVLFRFLEEIYDEVLSIRDSLSREGDRSEANSNSPDTLPVGAKAGEAGSPPSSPASPAPYDPWTVKNGRRV